MRSRASGGSCGDSVAATSALTMSSLRRRAIWMQRARSAARSSTGGRASARTTAPASPGSTSSRSHASTSRTSARWKNAAAPTSRNGTARSSSATATAWPSLRTERTSTPTRSGATPSRDQPLDVGGDALRLRALVRAAPERDRAGPGPPRPRAGCRAGRRSARRPRAPRPARARRAERALERARPSPRAGRPEVAQVLRRRAAEADDRLVVVGRRGHGRGRRPAARTSRPGRGRVLELVDEHVAEALGAARADLRAVAQDPAGLSDEVADVERALLGEQPVVVRIERGELALARARGRRRLRVEAVGPRRVVGGGDQLGLQRSMRSTTAPSSAPGCRGSRAAQRQLVDALEQQREPVGGRHRHEERVEPASSASSAAAGRRSPRRRDRELLERRPARGPRPRRAARRPPRRAGEQQDVLRRAALLDEPREALDQHARLAGARAAEDEQRAAGVGHGAPLGGGQGCGGHLRRIWPDARRPRRRQRVDGLARRLAPRRRGPARGPRRAPDERRARGGDRQARRGRRPHARHRPGGRGRPSSPSSTACTPRAHASARSPRSAASSTSVDAGAVLVVIDPIDGSMNAKRGLPHHALSIAVAEGTTMADVVFGYVLDLGPGRGVGRPPRRGRLLNGERLASRRPSAAPRRASSSSWRSSPPTRAGSADAADALARAVHRLRAIGSIAISLCQVAARARRRDGHAVATRARSTPPPRSSSCARAAATSPSRLRRSARRAARPRAALAGRRGPHRARARRARRDPGRPACHHGAMIDWRLAAQVARCVAGAQPAPDGAAFARGRGPHRRRASGACSPTPACSAPRAIPGARGGRPPGVARRQPHLACATCSTRSPASWATASACCAAALTAAAGLVVAAEVGGGLGLPRPARARPVRAPAARPAGARAAAASWRRTWPAAGERSRSTPRTSCAGSPSTRSPTRCSSRRCRGCATTSRGWSASCSARSRSTPGVCALPQGDRPALAGRPRPRGRARDARRRARAAGDHRPAAGDHGRRRGPRRARHGRRRRRAAARPAAPARRARAAAAAIAPG